MKFLSLVLTAVVIASTFTACGICPKSKKSGGACCSSECPPSKGCPAGSPQCKAK